jgi:vacuolar-type H+-ATPase subunit C/Vma6
MGVKAHVLFGRLLTADAYKFLLDSKDTSEVAAKLRSTYYGEYMNAIGETPRIHEIEEMLKASMIMCAHSFLNSMGGQVRGFYDAWFSTYDAANLKNIFRYIMSGKSDRDDLRRKLYPVKTSNLPYESLLLSKNFTEVADLLRGTRFYKELEVPLRRLENGDEKSLFPIETEIDSFVERNLFKALKNLGTEEKTALMPFIGARADTNNLYMLYRAMTYYNLPPEYTLSFMLPTQYRVSWTFLREAVKQENFDAVIDMVRERLPVYSPIIANTESKYTVELNMRRFMFAQAIRGFRSGSPGFHTAMSYFFIRRYEISDVILSLECVRYGYDRDKVLRLLTIPVVLGGVPEWQ